MTTSPQFERIDPSCRIEEETLRDYKAERYYPVQIGQVFNDRYKVIGKLGYGSASTVWLCRDLHEENGYVALKVYVNSSKVHRELPIYKHINSLQLEHGGRAHVRKLLESFELEGPHGRHICLVHQPLGISFDELRELTPDGVFGVDLIRQTIRHILAGLECLHEAHVIHTGKSKNIDTSPIVNVVQDLQPNNMLMGIDDPSIFAKFEQYEAESPVPRKELDGRIIYMSRPMPLSKGLPLLSDLSEARFGGSEHIDLIMPDVYRAPEVILGMPWSYPVDI
ncbi:MAG: hypothetical protein M1819_001362 [Sarea resinae]|nr:MAG: hypothetical protein M1819_001362 [Sarea resinae]